LLLLQFQLKEEHSNISEYVKEKASTNFSAANTTHLPLSHHLSILLKGSHKMALAAARQLSSSGTRHYSTHAVQLQGMLLENALRLSSSNKNISLRESSHGQYIGLRRFHNIRGSSTVFRQTSIRQCLAHTPQRQTRSGQHRQVAGICSVSQRWMSTSHVAMAPNSGDPVVPPAGKYRNPWTVLKEEFKVSVTESV
jgi:hypothetical protein